MSHKERKHLWETVKEFKCSGKTPGLGSRLLGLNFASSTYHLYESERNYSTALSVCEVGIIVNTKGVVSIIDKMLNA